MTCPIGLTPLAIMPRAAAKAMDALRRNLHARANRMMTAGVDDVEHVGNESLVDLIDEQVAEFDVRPDPGLGEVADESLFLGARARCSVGEFVFIEAPRGLAEDRHRRVVTERSAMVAPFADRVLASRDEGFDSGPFVARQLQRHRRIAAEPDAGSFAVNAEGDKPSARCTIRRDFEVEAAAILQHGRLPLFCPSRVGLGFALNASVSGLMIVGS